MSNGTRPTQADPSNVCTLSHGGSSRCTSVIE
jgi:hypothetical protein